MVVPPPSGDDRDAAAVQFDQALGGRHPQPGAARLGRLEGTEQRGLDFSGNARPAISHLDALPAIAGARVTRIMPRPCMACAALISRF